MSTGADPDAQAGDEDGAGRASSPVPREADPRTGEVVLKATDVVKTYGVTRALKGVAFSIHRGQVTTLFGENGAGKSTLMKILSGVEQPTSGS